MVIWNGCKGFGSLELVSLANVDELLANLWPWHRYTINSIFNVHAIKNKSTHTACQNLYDIVF